MTITLPPAVALDQARSSRPRPYEQQQGQLRTLYKDGDGRSVRAITGEPLSLTGDSVFRSIKKAAAVAATVSQGTDLPAVGILRAGSGRAFQVFPMYSILPPERAASEASAEPALQMHFPAGRSPDIDRGSLPHPDLVAIVDGNRAFHLTNEPPQRTHLPRAATSPYRFAAGLPGS